MKKEITIYSNKKIETIDDLKNILSICYDAPEDRCDKSCYKKCRKYLITIEDIGKSKIE